MGGRGGGSLRGPKVGKDLREERREDFREGVGGEGGERGGRGERGERGGKGGKDLNRKKQILGRQREKISGG